MYITAVAIQDKRQPLSNNQVDTAKVITFQCLQNSVLVLRSYMCISMIFLTLRDEITSPDFVPGLQHVRETKRAGVIKHTD